VSRPPQDGQPDTEELIVRARTADVLVIVALQLDGTAVRCVLSQLDLSLKAQGCLQTRSQRDGTLRATSDSSCAA
jgi:hypothetical protein